MILFGASKDTLLDYVERGRTVQTHHFHCTTFNIVDWIQRQFFVVFGVNGRRLLNHGELCVPELNGWTNPSKDWHKKKKEKKKEKTF